MDKQKSIYAAYEEIKQREISELKSAIEKSGQWKIRFSEELAPIVMCNFDRTMPHPSDVRIIEVTLIDGNLNFYGEEKVVSGGAESYEGYYAIPTSSIAYGHIEFITSAIHKEKKHEICDETRRLCETVSELSNLLYGALYLKLHDSFAVDREIIRLAIDFEESFDRNTDFLEEIDKYAQEYFKKIDD